MDVRAILLLTGPRNANGHAAEFLGDVPISLLPVLGKPVLHHVIDRLRGFSVDAVTVVSDVSSSPFARDAARPGLKWISATGEELWRAAENVFSDYAQSGAELVLLLRLGPYAELDLEELVQFHLDSRQRVSCVIGPNGPLDACVISASRRNDAAYLLRHQLAEFRSPPGQFFFRGYMNRLADAHDLRRLTLDGLLLRCAVVPSGRQAKPGVWVEDGARIHRAARVLAPAFIGARTRIRAAAVITRCTAVEHHCEVDCGTVVENSTLLPYTYLGAGLDVTHSVVGLKRVVHLRRNVEVEFEDPKLTDMVSTHAPFRALASAASLAGFLPRQIFRGLFARSQREQPSALPEAAHAPASALQTPKALEGVAAPDSTQFPADLAMVRRYGDQ
jgi:hypothetical protein